MFHVIHTNILTLHDNSKRMDKVIDMELFRYELPEDRIAKYPLEDRSKSKLLLYREGEIATSRFDKITEHLPSGAMLVFNNTKVIAARLIFFKESGAKIEILALEPSYPADYERMFATCEPCRWSAMVGGAKRWKSGKLSLTHSHEGSQITLFAELVERGEGKFIVEFSWSDTTKTFGQVLEHFGKMPLPPYLDRELTDEDSTRYQTVYSRHLGSVAAPTAGLHFTDQVLAELTNSGISKQEVTLHVGAGTFLPVKASNAADHVMHTEHFSISLDSLKAIRDKLSNIIAVGTTSVRTLESLSVIGYRCWAKQSDPLSKVVGQWEAYDIPCEVCPKEIFDSLIAHLEQQGLTKLEAKTQIMITPEYKFRVISGLVTNFHQPSSTLLLLISAVVGDKWRDIYSYALEQGYRFLSYGDSSLLMIDKR